MENDWRELVRKNDLLALAQKKVTKQMSRDELERRIAVFIKTHNMCVLCTAKDNVPRATPIEYWADGTTLYMGADPGSKRENIKANPKVSVGIFDPFVGSLSVKGMQITGEATLLTDDNPEFDYASILERRELVGEDVGDFKPRRDRTVIKVEAKKIELLDVALKLEGYDLKYVWEA
jgi:nitroimidazol reductase NimA-like FMN-containing flavoprotein (pyridoxamine 5'-phosphate oxidase superfamily)